MPSNPKVSFVIPCYNLAHYLAECVNSILGQTYENFEVLIMDDCSPDNTPEVAQSFQDPRVRHIRNEPNCGHLRNYNKGIELSRGEYVWLISADDKLRKPYALEKYLRLADRCPKVGYVISPGIEIENGTETRLGGYSIQAAEDNIFKGHAFLQRLLGFNSVIAASGMVRKSCYERWGAFPLDMPYAGDWYLWCLFALHSDVGYIAEPLVDYRGHAASMTNCLLQEKVELCAADDLAVLWRVKSNAEELGFRKLAQNARHAIAYAYARQLKGTRFRTVQYQTSFDKVECSLARHAGAQDELRWLRARIYASLGDMCFLRNSRSEASEYYDRGLREDPKMLRVRLKSILLRTGSSGSAFRKGVASLRRKFLRSVT